MSDKCVVGENDLTVLLDKPIALSIKFSVVNQEARIIRMTYEDRLDKYVKADEKVVNQIKKAVERR